MRAVSLVCGGGQATGAESVPTPTAALPPARTQLQPDRGRHQRDERLVSGGAVDEDDAGRDGPRGGSRGPRAHEVRPHHARVAGQQQQLHARVHARVGVGVWWCDGRGPARLGSAPAAVQSSGSHGRLGSRRMRAPSQTLTGMTAKGSCTDCKMLMYWLRASSCVQREGEEGGGVSPTSAGVAEMRRGGRMHLVHAAG